MGLFKKKGGEEDDANRSALFGSRKGKASPAGSNPYANPPPPYQGGASESLRQEKSPAVTAQGQQYGTNPNRGYQADGGAYGGGYGSERYGNAGADQGSRRPGGYGGLGPADPNDDADRGALFGGAADRYQQRQQATQQPGGNSYGQSGAYGSEAPGGYGSGPSYDDRQLTAEEQEEEDISATKNEIKFMKQQDVSSTRNALR